MENKKVGWLILGISAIVLVIVFIFNYSLKKIVDESCTHGIQCTMHDTINSQLWLSIAIVAIIAIIGLYVMFSKPEEKIITKTKMIKEKIKPLNLEGLDESEKKAIQFIQEEGKAMFQKELMEKLEIGKVKMTRILDKLEAKQLIIRKRRGMNNIVVIKD